MPDLTAQRRAGAFAWLALAICSVSFSAIFIKFAQAPPLTIAANRMLASVLLLAGPTLAIGWPELARLKRSDLAALVVSGLFLALHFGLWTTSLTYTSVASSVVFVTVHPILVAFVEWAWFRQAVSGNTWLGIGLAVLGSAVIGANDLQVGGQSLLGDALALAGAAAIVGYLLIGRQLRQRLGLLTYSTPVYFVSWLGLLGWASAAGEDVRQFPSSDLVWYVLLALFATLGGHTVVNWALRGVPASLVAVSLVGEPVGSAILAWLILGQAITPLTGIGGAIILFGIYLAAR